MTATTKEFEKVRQQMAANFKETVRLVRAAFGPRDEHGKVYQALELLELWCLKSDYGRKPSSWDHSPELRLAGRLVEMVEYEGGFLAHAIQSAAKAAETPWYCESPLAASQNAVAHAEAYWRDLRQQTRRRWAPHEEGAFEAEPFLGTWNYPSVFTGDGPREVGEEWADFATITWRESRQKHRQVTSG